jgi:glycosyltransferase involved in cell wall biosynthesis
MLARRGGEFARRACNDGFPVFTFPGRGRSPWGLWSIRRRLGRDCPDVLHYNDPHALTSAGLAALGLPIVARVVARRVDFPVKSPRRYLWLSDGIACVSRAVMRECLKAGIPESHLHLVHDGVDPAFAESGDRSRGRRSLGLGNDQLLLLTVAKLTDHKGHEFLFRAMPAILRSQQQVVLALAGDGELRGGLEQLARQLDVTPRVRFLGFRQDIPDLLAAADLVVQPSRLEGLCSSIIDAMLAARPVVATSAGGIPDLIGTEEAAQVAWIVPPGCPDRIAEAIVEALERPAERQLRDQRGRQRALAHFTAESMVEATLSVYHAISARNRRAAESPTF